MISTLELAERLGVTYRQIDRWVANGYLDCDTLNPTRHSPRQFTDAQAEAARYLVLLARHGIGMDLAGPLARDLQAHGRADFGMFAITLRSPR